MKITIDVSDAITYLEGIRKRLTDSSRLWNSIGMTILQREKEIFDKEGPGWAALAPRTIYDKKRMGFPMDILIRTGALKSSLTQKGAVGSIFEGNKHSLTIGTEIHYALPLYTGAPSKNLPSRPMLIDEETAIMLVEEKAAKFLSEGVL